LLIIGWSSRRFYSYIKLTRPLSKVLGTLAEGSRHVVIVVPKLYSPPSETTKLKRPGEFTESINWHPSLPLLAEGDARAMMYVYNLLLKSGKTANALGIKSDVEATGEERAGDLVCIGAGSNSVTKDLLTTRNPSLSFEQLTIRTEGQDIRVFGSSVVDRETRESWVTNRIHDYGLITRLRGSGADALILAGLGPSGTVASGYFLSVHWKKIYDYLEMRKSTDKNYVVLLQTEIADPTVANLIKIVVF
jgi:hypothetical protein